MVGDETKRRNQKGERKREGKALNPKNFVQGWGTGHTMLFASDLPYQLLPWPHKLSNHLSQKVRSSSCPWHPELYNPDTKAVLPRRKKWTADAVNGYV